MNVLHLDEQRGWRGGEQQASYLAQGLARRGHRVWIAGRCGGAFAESEHGGAPVERVALPFRGEVDPGTVWAVARLVRRHGIDILHAHASHSHTVACLARRLAGQGKVVVSRRVDFAPRRHLLNRWKYALPDRIIAISERIEAVLRAFGVDNARLRLVHSGIDPARFDVVPLPRAELGMPPDAVLAGNVAALVGHKDHGTLLEAIAIARKRVPRLRLVIAGEGDLRPELEARIARLDLGDAVKLLGYRRDVPRLLRALDVFVLSSKMEGLGTSVLDAMACGVPVVATAAGGIPEMVRHEETGLLVPPEAPDALAEALVRVVESPETARASAERAREMVLERFTVDRMVEGNLAVYRELAEE